MKRIIPLTILAFFCLVFTYSNKSPAQERTVRDVSVFYDALSPYGDWVEDPNYGSVWLPADVEPDWRPYSHGQWAWTDDYGWTWVSDYEWGWACFHYGRWFYSDDYNGWAWVPGTEWAPAWVGWRRGAGYIGWAPLPPGVHWQSQIGFDVGEDVIETRLRPNYWCFVEDADFYTPEIGIHLILPMRNVVMIERTRFVRYHAPHHNFYANIHIDINFIERVCHRRVERFRIRDVGRADRHGTYIQNNVINLYRPRVMERHDVHLKPPRVVDRDVAVREVRERRERVLREGSVGRRRGGELEKPPTVQEHDGRGPVVSGKPGASENRGRRDLENQLRGDGKPGERERSRSQVGPPVGSGAGKPEVRLGREGRGPTTHDERVQGGKPGEPQTDQGRGGREIRRPGREGRFQPGGPQSQPSREERILQPGRPGREERIQRGRPGDIGGKPDIGPGRPGREERIRPGRPDDIGGRPNVESRKPGRERVLERSAGPASRQETRGRDGSDRPAPRIEREARPAPRNEGKPSNNGGGSKPAHNADKKNKDKGDQPQK